MKNTEQPQRERTQSPKFHLWGTFFFFLLPFALFSQVKDTIIVKFNEQNEEMRKANFTKAVQAGSPEEKLEQSIAYYIEQMEPHNGYDSEFSFSHFNQSQRAYKIFGGESPGILYKTKAFLKGKKVLDIDFFRTTPYIQIAKTFEKENSREEGVIIFIMDVDEMKNDSIILRQVDFSRPIKQ